MPFWRISSYLLKVLFICVCVGLGMFVCACLYVRARLYVCVRLYVSVPRVGICARLLEFAIDCVCDRECVCARVYICARVFVYVYSRV